MNRLKLCFITLLCVLPLFGSMAQSVKIEGSVRDSQTDELLPGVNKRIVYRCNDKYRRCVLYYRSKGFCA